MSDPGSERLDDFFSTARVTGTDERIELAGTDYRPFLYPLDDETLAPWRGMGYQEFADARRDDRFLQALLDDWNALLDEPFVGVTSDGTVREGLYELPKSEQPNGGQTDASGRDTAIVAAAEHVVAALSDAELAEVRHPLDAREWRAWSNPEFVFHRVGLRLDDLDDAQVAAVLALVEASLSPEGYRRVAEAMELNGFLGELTELPSILNARSYFFALYGDPASGEPWGWQLFGHHVALHFVTVGGRHVIAPVFLGAEPALSDERPPIFAAREATALALAASLTDEQRASAVVFESVLDPRMPEGRLHPADERHLAGAFRDNRLIPYEGISAYDLDDEQWALVSALVDDFLLLLRDDQRALTLADVEAHRDETWFAWYGGIDGTEPFYFRIQSPVIVAELDHHAGVWLSNRVPQRFHVHSTLRLPNGNDYGRAYIAQWRERPETQED
jgi:hypothetical protein